MRYYTQLRHDDCFRTCLASLLDIHPTKVPNFYGDDNYISKEVSWSRLISWLKQFDATPI